MGEATPGRRATVIASLTPLEELDGDPFLVDTRIQTAMCSRWASEYDWVITRELIVHGLEPGHRELWADVEEGLVDLFLVPNLRVLERAVGSVEEFTAGCERRGVRVATADLPEPAYGARAKARIHRRLSMPTAGYDGC